MSIRPTDEILQEPFWKGLAEGRLLVQRCGQCGTYRHPPNPICFKCRSFAHEFMPVSGKGHVYSFTVARHSVNASLDSQVPYIIALVDLDEGVRMVSAIHRANATDVRIGLRVVCVIEPISSGFALPFFVPASEDAQLPTA